MTLREEILQRIRANGPLPFATYAALALYHPELGYYARADRRSGRAGDFFTSVDLGPVFGALLAAQLAEMWQLLASSGGDANGGFDLVEAAAGSGRLARDVLDAAAADAPEFYAAINLHLVERSPTARAAQASILGPHAFKLASSGPELPSVTHGAIVANELLDALPPHVVVMTDDGLREVYVDAPDERTRFVERLGPISDPRVLAHIDERAITLEPGWRAEVVPDAVEWVRQAARSIRRGFLLLIDYGHEADELYSATHATGTLTTYHQHRVANEAHQSTPPWLVDPGGRDITAHVDLTAVRETAEQAGLQTLGILDQTYFLIGLGVAEGFFRDSSDNGVSALKRRLAMKSLLVPGGLGSTHKVLIFGQDVGTPRLAGCSYRVRMT